jgi:hypothetical protein
VTLFSKISVGLQTLFPSSGADVPRPRELTDVVHLVHPFPSQASDLQGTARTSLTSGASVTPALSTPATPDGFFDEWAVAHVGHTMTAATVARIRLSLADNSGGTIILGIWNFDQAVTGFLPVYASGIFVNGAFASPTQMILPERPILVAPGWHLELIGDTQGVAYTVTLAGLVFRRSLADVPLHRG